jgi:hypothetical protein
MHQFRAFAGAVRTYAASAQRFGNIVAQAGADVHIANHTNQDNSLVKMAALATPALISLDPITSISAWIARRCDPNTTKMPPTIGRHPLRQTGWSHRANVAHTIETWRRHQFPIVLAASQCPNCPRLPALALFGRRPLQRAVTHSSRRQKTCTKAVLCIAARTNPFRKLAPGAQRCPSRFAQARRVVRQATSNVCRINSIVCWTASGSADPVP